MDQASKMPEIQRINQAKLPISLKISPKFSAEKFRWKSPKGILMKLARFIKILI